LLHPRLRVGDELAARARIGEGAVGDEECESRTNATAVHGTIPLRGPMVVLMPSGASSMTRSCVLARSASRIGMPSSAPVAQAR
jgi:hypothetical protein